MRIVYYLNQFFGGIGGEEEAGRPPEIRSGALGPGRLLEQILGEDSKVVTTVICGDNYAAENVQEVAGVVTGAIKEAQGELLMAGPCFQAGRYGAAAGAVCAAVQDELGISAITAMASENPGVDLYRESIYIVDSGDDVSRMRDVLSSMAHLGTMLVNKETIGRPADEGYFSQGKLRSEFVAQTAAHRLSHMLLSKVRGEFFEAEVPLQAIEATPPPPPVPDMSRATVALVTDGGLVPSGNPDRIPRAFAQVWGAYTIEGMDSLRSGEYEVAHGGYDNRPVEEDPHRLVPVDVLREMERDGLVGKLHPEFLSTTGNSNPLENSRRMGREMAARLKEAGVDSVILTST
jgi:glycine reductase